MKHDDIIIWLVKLILESTVNSALRWCALSTDKKKMESRPLITPLYWKQKLLVSCKKMHECVQAPFSWGPDTAGLLQALTGGISPDYSPAAALLWQQWFLIFFPFCIIFVPRQPPTKRINHTTIINTAGQRVLVVGVVLAEGTSGPSPTVLQFTVNIPKTGFFNFILRYKVRLQSRWVCVFATTTHECTLSSDRMIDLPFTCTVKQSNHPEWEDLMVACENSSTGALCL